MNNTQASEDVKKLEMLSLPKNRYINSYAVAEQIVQNACSSHKTLWDLIDACNRHIAGEKPVKQDELKKRGMSWVWNYNYGKARAKMEKATSESCAIISSALSLGYCTFRKSEKEDLKDPVLRFLANQEQRGIVASVIGASLSSTLASETRLSGWLNEVEYPSFAYGYAALVFDPFDWMPTPVHPLNIAFRPNTKPEKINQFVTFRIMEVEELYDRWVTAKNEKTVNDNREHGQRKRIASSGWNLDGLEELLLHAFKGKIGDNKVASSWADVMPSFQSDASSVMQNTDNVTIAKIFHRELDGTLSETYIPYNNKWQSEDGKKSTEQSSVNNIIFSRNHGTYNQRDHIGLVRDSGFTTDSGFIQEYRGLAKYAVEDSTRYNRHRNGIGNKMQFVGAPMFEQPTTQSGEKFKVTMSQGFVLLPPSHNLIEKQPSFDIQSHIAVLQFEEREYNRDTQQYDASIQGRLTSRPNKGEVQQVSSEVEFTNSAKRSVKMRDYAAIFHSVIDRMPNVKCKKTDSGYYGKKKFYDYIKKNLDWLVKTDADVNLIIKSIDSFIMEPVSSSIETITMALQMAETPFGRNRLKRMMLVAKGFPIEEVNNAVPLTQDKFVNMQDARVSAIENDMFFTTNEVVMAGTDDDIVHLDSHMSKCERILQGVQQQALSPVDAFKYLENNLNHCLGHIDKLGQDPILNKKAQDYVDKIKQFLQAKDQIKGMADQMMQEQQQAQQQVQIDPETRNKIESKNAELSSNIQRKDFIAQNNTERKSQQMMLNHEEKMKQIELENERKQKQL